MGEAFVERFDGGVDERWSVSDGWSNGGWMTNDWRRSSVETAPGLMAILLQPGPEGSKYKLSSGELQSHDRHRYGYFEVRMKVPRGAGLVTGFFSYAGQDGRTRPNEIDIEILGRNTRVAELTIHENGKATSTKVTLPFDAADGFHVYGFDWQPGHVRWYIDGQLVHAETGGAARRLVRPQQLILNLWASEQLDSWVGKLDLAKAAWRLDVSCMAYAATYSGRICS
jgi:beta-glucanase (GH16 family)